MSDLIRREDTIKALRLEYPTMPMFKSLREEWAIKTEGFRKAEEVIMKLPSADRPQGEWEIVGKNHPYKRCPFCKRVRAFTDTRFCDWCGARMKGADDEDN